ncbi:hypothetical protein KVR01_006416 [Diaporthe batatas]|uniref:uncharacterized protein n=1 Tax=Diaporthe batatas TaxID=748121 RepID=UPI001D0420C0|nr:uncharacterized protein KVR01_006416 [Diaporthe batatas]KAG8164498.1 hypothetical protein KVR01_006416 [Diaporthe batatas]
MGDAQSQKPFKAVDLPKYIGPSWVPITTAMQQLATGPKPSPPGASILAINSTQQLAEEDFDDPTRWQAIIAARPAARTSQAVPHRAIWSSADSVFVRLPDGRDVVTTIGNAVVLAEGETWCGAVGGQRIPRAVLEAEESGRPSFAGGLVRAPISPLRTALQWREEFPKRTSHLFRNEELVGEKLLEVQTRKGESRYLVVDTVNERTPEGYTRNFLGALRKIPVETSENTGI